MPIRMPAAAALILIMLSIASFISLSKLDEGEFSIESGSTKTSDGVSISYHVYVPAGEGPFPGVLVGHGFSASKEIMDGYARALAESGFIVYSYDHRGHGHSDGALSSDRNMLLADVKAVLELLRADSRAMQGNYALVGYSMGGGAGYLLAEEDPDLVAMVGVAPALDNVGDRPSSLLVIVGALDELFSPSSYRSILSSRIGIEPDEIGNGTIYDNGGLQTELWVSPYHDHLTISYSASAHERCVAWISQAMGVAPVGVRTATRMFYALTGVLSGIAAMICLILIIPKNENKHRTRPLPQDNIIRDIASNILFFPLTALIIAPTIVLGLPMSTGYLMLLAMGAIPIWRKLSKEHEAHSKLDIIKDLFSGTRNSYIYAILAGLGTYGVLYAFIGGRYLGIVPSIARLPAILFTFLILSFVFALDAWGYMHTRPDERPYGRIYDIIRYGATRLASIAVIVILMSLASGNSFFIIALYAGVPLVALYSVLMWAVFDRTASYGAAAVCSALVLAPMLAAVSPLIAIV